MSHTSAAVVCGRGVPVARPAAEVQRLGRVGRRAADIDAGRLCPVCTTRRTSARRTSARRTSARRTSARRTSARRTSARRTSARRTSARRTSARRTARVITMTNGRMRLSIVAH